AGLFRYGRTFAHEAQSVLIEIWCRRLSDSVFSSPWSGRNSLLPSGSLCATGHLQTVTRPRITSRSLSGWSSLPSFTPKQGQYLAFIDAYTRVLGRPPAEADLQRHFGVSPPSVHQMVLTLDAGSVCPSAPITSQEI